MSTRRKYVFVLYLTVMTAVVLLSAIPSHCQEASRQGAAASGGPSPAAAAAPDQEAAQKNELSIYGEVQAVNVQAGSITAQYYDYDNDEEKSIEIILNKDTKLENVKTIEEIKKGDWVDAAYAASAGKNIATLISVEKEEPIEESAAGAAEE